MKSNVQKLGEILSGRMKKTADAAVPMTIELGTISSSLALITDSLQASIPKGDYMVTSTLAATTYQTSKETVNVKTDTEEIESNEHDHKLPSVFRGLKPGDRVLVAWVGYEPIVIAIVVSS